MIHFFPPPKPSPASIVLYLDPVTYFFSKYREGSPRSKSTTFCIFKTILAKIQVTMLNCAPFWIFSIYLATILCASTWNFFEFFLCLLVGLHTIVKYLKNANAIAIRMLPSRSELARSLIRELGNRTFPIVAESIRIFLTFKYRMWKWNYG